MSVRRLPSARSTTCVAALLVALFGCGEEHARPAPPPAAPRPAATAEEGEVVWFVDAADEAGLAFDHVSGHREAFLMPEIMGGGAALADVDGDGRLDVYLVQSGSLHADGEHPGNRLFLNQGGLRFRDATEESGAGDTGYGMGVTAGDVDNDGDVDLYVTNWGPNVLLVNDGAGHFEDRTAASGTGHAGWGTSAALLDVEADGDLDLFVVDYLDWTPDGELTCHNELGQRDYCSPQNYAAPARDVLLLNDGSARFVDASVTSGVAGVPGTGLGIGCGDFDGDGLIDVFVANDGMPDALWRNLGAGRFEEVALVAGCAVDHSGRSKAGMGVALADVDDDGDLDLLVCNLDRQADSFFINHGGWFQDETPRAGLAQASRPFTRFGMGLVDFDLDGRLDLYQANGRVTARARSGPGDPYAETDLLLAGRAPATEDALPAFGPLATADGTARPPTLTGRAAAFGDLDDDGGIDVVVVNRDGPVRLLHNVAAARGDGHWIGFAVRDAHGRDALGATVTVRTGERAIVRDVRAASSYLASNDPRVHVGLGPEDVVDAVEVRWVDGVVEAFGARDVDRYHELVRGAGETR